jgi:hypothetical protein
MKTNLFYLLVLMTLVGSRDLSAGVLVKNQDGTTVAIEDWSKPEAVEIPSGERKVQVERRRCVVLQTGSSGVTTKHEVEMLFEPKTRELWLGMPESKHVILRGRIFGMRPTYGKLMIAKSSNAADLEGGEVAIAEEFFRKVAREPTLSVWLDEKSMSRLDLARVFGDVILPKGTSRIVENSVDLVSVSSSSDAMVLSMTTLAGHKLSLTLNENLDILEAKQDGQPFLALFDGRGGSPKGHKFNGPGSASVSTQRGAIRAIVGSREYSLVGARGEEIGSSTVIAAVMPDTGELWIGPSPCKLARLAGGVVGFLVENKNELWIIRDQGVRIPPPPMGRAVFDDALQRFSADFESHQRQWSPYLKVNLSQIVQASGLSCEGWEFWINTKDSSFRENGLVLLLGTSDTRTKVEVSLSADLKLQSSRVVKSE